MPLCSALEQPIKMNIYNTPESKLDIETTLGTFPKAGWVVISIYIIEGLFSSVLNYLPVGSEAAIELLSLESLIVIVLSFGIVMYVWHLLKNGKRALHTINYILLAVVSIPAAYEWVVNGIDTSLIRILEVLSILMLLVIVVLCNTKKLKIWLSHN